MGLSSWLHPCLKVGCACDQPPGGLTTPDCCTRKETEEYCEFAGSTFISINIENLKSAWGGECIGVWC